MIAMSKPGAGPGVGREVVPPGRERGIEHSRGDILDVRLAGLQTLDAFAVDIEANHVVPDLHGTHRER